MNDVKKRCRHHSVFLEKKIDLPQKHDMNVEQFIFNIGLDWFIFKH
jgi:hypothetical protein